jgi:SAM-dependent methyltransferase
MTDLLPESRRGYSLPAMASTTDGGSTAARQWADELAAWRIDPEILESVRESPYGFPPAVFAAGRTGDPSPLELLARPALRPGGTVLDVGAGAGAASLHLVPAGGRLHAVDSQPSMLRALVDDADRRGVAVTTYDGTWPDLAAQVPVCDVVVCAHVLYNVPAPVPFVAALRAHARDLVVLELTERHPLVRLAPMWQRVHHQSRPSGPTADLVVAVLREAGFPEPRRQDQVREPLRRTGELAEAWVDLTRRQLCLPPERRDEVVALMAELPPQPRRVVGLAWPGTAPA